MLTKATIDRIDLSESVISAWDAIGGPGGTPAELVRMIEAELRVLAGLRDGDPERIDGLILRYKTLRSAHRSQIG